VTVPPKLRAAHSVEKVATGSEARSEIGERVSVKAYSYAAEGEAIEMKTPMKIDFDDTLENWRLWGELVELWIFDLSPKPATTAQLVNQMTAHGIAGASVYGPPDRGVHFWSYTDDDNLVILLPSSEMVKQGRKSTQPGQAYPLPVFYDAAYNGSRKVFTEDDGTLFAACRIGEHTISEST
jgi:hypothetical protein